MFSHSVLGGIEGIAVEASISTFSSGFDVCKDSNRAHKTRSWASNFGKYTAMVCGCGDDVAGQEAFSERWFGLLSPFARGRFLRILGITQMGLYIDGRSRASTNGI